MADLSTTYLGMPLANPLVPSASPLSRDTAMAKQLEDAGAAALIMYSLFEEEIRQEEETLLRFLHHQDIGNPEADSFQPVPDDYQWHMDKYLEQLQALKLALDIPVIASLNGVSMDGWLSAGRELERAGADALELNVYYVAADPLVPGYEVEDRYVRLLKELRHHIRIPIVMKLSPQFSSVAHLVYALEQAGADGVALFNRFYQPDIDLNTLKVVHDLDLSTSSESRLRIRWTAILRGHVDMTLAVTGGLHSRDDVLKALFAGADVTHMCSALLLHGPQHLATVLAEVNTWLDEHEYSSINQLKGSVSQQHSMDPAAYERANYLSVIDSYSPAPGVLR